MRFTALMMEATIALETRSEGNSRHDSAVNTYKTPRLIVIQMGTLTDSFIFNFQIMVPGKMASAASENEFIAKACERSYSQASLSITYMLEQTRDVLGHKVVSTWLEWYGPTDRLLVDIVKG